MDRLTIPNYSIVLPGTEDSIWVYNGKGPTKKHAMASALMESIERYCSLPSSSNTSHQRFVVTGSYKELSKKYNVLHPHEVVEPFKFKYRDEIVIDFMQGTELFTHTPILVPAALALYSYGRSPPLDITNTNANSGYVSSSSSNNNTSVNDNANNPFLLSHTVGLASGNVLEEAVCHALCEVIEHDAVSIAQLVASAIPFTILIRMIDSFRAQRYPVTQIPPEKYVDDKSIFQDVDISELDFPPVNYLTSKFQNAGISLLIKDVTSDIGIPTFIAGSVEWITQDYALSAIGQGTHPDARIALIRAITEVSQTRAGNVQGARDDLIKKILKDDDYKQHERNWKFTESTKEKVKFSNIASFVNEDILDDINLILSRLKKCGLKKAIIVDLTNPNIGIPVVRAIVPGLENFDATESVMGKRAKEHFRRLRN
jgi:ribosomal protein S12 methylthiotransferase accessory factor YcaO